MSAPPAQINAGGTLTRPRPVPQSTVKAALTVDRTRTHDRPTLAAAAHGARRRPGATSPRARAARRFTVKATLTARDTPGLVRYLITSAVIARFTHMSPSQRRTTRRKPRRVAVETADYAQMLRRMIRSYGRRVAAADVEDLAAMISLRDDLDDAIAGAIAGQRADLGRSWTDIGRAAGTTKQAAFQKWGTK